MGSKTVGKALGISTSSGSSSNKVYTPQYVRLADGTMSLYDSSKATLNYSPAGTTQGAKGRRSLGDSAFSKTGKNRTLESAQGAKGRRSLRDIVSSKTGDNRTLESAQYDGQDVELSGGKIKLYSQADYDNYQAEQTQKQLQLSTALSASQTNLENARKSTKKNSIFSGRTTASNPSGGGGGVFTGITE